MENRFRIERSIVPGEYRLEQIFADIRGCGVLNAIFDNAEEIDRVVSAARVIVMDRPYEMFVDNDDGSITIGLDHLRSASEVFLHLDIVHELCHVKQHLQGRDLYDQSKSYVDRETEIEAYQITVQEARRLALEDDAIRRYLRVSWITPEEHLRLVRRLKVQEDPGEGDS
jgi:hypothetical protein